MELRSSTSQPALLGPGSELLAGMSFGVSLANTILPCTRWKPGEYLPWKYVFIREGTCLKLPNHYEFLQISPNAEAETIHRVYRFLAVRFHPDNPDTGNADQFFELKQAYEVLSDPGRRAEYDRSWNAEVLQPDPLSTSFDFMDDMEGELNRRLGLLAVLYLRRRMHPESPAVSLHEVESRMGFPRDYLEFTIWYLHKKGFITKADNSEFTLTADGVDFVETQRVSLPVLQKLLTSSAGIHPPERRSPVPSFDIEPMPVHVAVERRTRGDRRKRQR